jgi:hypothetical protein
MARASPQPPRANPCRKRNRVRKSAAADRVLHILVGGYPRSGLGAVARPVRSRTTQAPGGNILGKGLCRELGRTWVGHRMRWDGTSMPPISRTESWIWSKSRLYPVSIVIWGSSQCINMAIFASGRKCRLSELFFPRSLLRCWSPHYSDSQSSPPSHLPSQGV